MFYDYYTVCKAVRASLVVMQNKNRYKLEKEETYPTQPEFDLYSIKSAKQTRTLIRTLIKKYPSEYSKQNKTEIEKALESVGLDDLRRTLKYGIYQTARQRVTGQLLSLMSN